MARKQQTEPEQVEPSEPGRTELMVIALLQDLKEILRKIEGHMAADAELKQRMMTNQAQALAGRQPLVAGQQYPRSGDTYGPKK